MDWVKDTNEFVEKMNDIKENDAKNKKQQGQGNPAVKLPNKQHSTNK
ncbi:MAG: DUF4023 domain-containing protein [Paenibacillaceae bacterium]